MLPFSMQDAVIAGVLTSASHTIVLSICLSSTGLIKEHLAWQVRFPGMLRSSHYPGQSGLYLETRVSSFKASAIFPAFITMPCTSPKCLLLKLLGGGGRIAFSRWAKIHMIDNPLNTGHGMLFTMITLFFSCVLLFFWILFSLIILLFFWILFSLFCSN